MNAPVRLPLQHRGIGNDLGLEIRSATANASARTIECVWTTGATVRRTRYVGWDTPVPFDEVLLVSPDAVDLTRMKLGAPVLDSHAAYSTRSQLAVVEDAWIVGGKGMARIRFPEKGTDAAADRMFELARQKIVRNISVGYAIDRLRIVPAQKEGDVEQRIAERWTPYEISFVTIPADAGAQTRAADQTFPLTITTGARSTPAAALPVDVQRSIEERVQAALATSRSTAPMTIHVSRDAGDTRRHAMADAIAFRMAGDRSEPAGAARYYVGLSLVEMAAECVGHRGMVRTAAEAYGVLDRAFAGHSVSDFPAIMLDAMNKRLLARYALAAPTYRFFAALMTARDFRPTAAIRAGDFPGLMPLGENGELKAGTFSESREQFQVRPYGVTLNISRQMIVNDSLGAIEQVVGSAGTRVADWENAQAFALLVQNPALLTDGKTVFHQDHGNLAAAGSAINVQAIGAGRAAMMRQTTLDGMKANLSPTILLTSPDKQTEAEQLVTAIVPNQTTGTVPALIRRLNPVADAHLSGLGWYLFADPAVAPTFVYGYLDGATSPRLSTQQQFNTQGLATKLEHDFGVAAVDYRPAFYNPGA